MDLYYKSTRNSNLKVTASEAILKGLAPDGGLFVPEKLPVLGKSMEELKDLNYQDTAYEVMKCFLTDFTEEELRNCIEKAYDSKFDDEAIAPLVKVEDTYYLELDLIRDEFPCEEYYATGMTQELDRCRWALEKARTSKRVALVCSGDAGVYGMASPLLELAPDYPDVAVEIVPGLTAALSGGAVLGAPLAHDFCVISLSDRLTPWEVIEKRLACAAMGDFCVALYNPSSKGRPDYLAKAVCILLENGKSADTVCGIVRNIGREGQTARILTLAQLKDTAVDMFTTVYIGNAATKQLGGRMVTPRGYRR